MAKNRGYHSYRGRRSKAKIALAVLLVLVILAAAAVILFQRNIVYDETGTPQLELPWLEKVPQESEEPLPEVDLTIEEVPVPVEKEELRAFSVAEAPLTLEGWRTAWMAAEQMGEMDGAAVLLKDAKGYIFFDASTVAGGARSMKNDTTAALMELLQGDTAAEHTIARIACFHDSRAANWDVEGMGLKNTGGYIFYDGNNTQWLDPAKPEARQYLCQLIVEAAAMGFDEILLTDVSYPTEGKLDKIAYGDTAKEQNLKTFLEEVAAALQPYETILSVEVTETALAAGRDAAAGQVLRDIAAAADRIYATAEPEQVELYTGAVAAVSETVLFVPEVTAVPETGSFLLMQ